MSEKNEQTDNTENSGTPRILFKKISEKREAIVNANLAKRGCVAVDLLIIPDGLETTSAQVKKAMNMAMNDMLADGMPTIETEPIRTENGFMTRKELVVGFSAYSGRIGFGESEEDIPSHFLYIVKQKKASDKVYEISRDELLKRTSEILVLFDKKPLPAYRPI